MAVGRPSGIGPQGSVSLRPLTSDSAPGASSVLNDYLFGPAAAPAINAPTVGVSTVQGGATADSTTTAGIATTTGRTLLVFVHWQDTSGVPTITDSNANAWSQVGATVAPSGGSFSQFFTVFKCENATGGAGHTFTASKTNGFTSMYVVELTASTVTFGSSATQTTGPYLSGNVSPAGDALLIALGAVEGTGVTNFAAGNSFTAIGTINDFAFWQGQTAQRAVAAGTYEASFTTPNALDGGALVVIATIPAGGAVTGTLAVTEGADTFAATGVSINRGTLAVTEGADTFAATGVSINRGTLAVTEGADTLAATGVSIERGTLAVTEGADTFAATGTVSGGAGVTGTLAVTEEADTFAATGVSINRATMAVTEGADTLVATGVSIERGTLAVTEGADTLAATGVSIERGTLAVTEGADTLAATGVSINRGALAVTEGADTLAATGVSIERGALAVTEGADTFAATGAVLITGTMAVTEGADTLAATGVSIERGTLAVTEGADTLAATGVVTDPGISGDLAVTEGADTVAATGVVGGAYTVTPSQALLLRKLYQLHGLDRSAPLAVSAGGRATGDVIQATSIVGSDVTLTTTAGHDTFYGDVGTMIEELAALHALAGPMTVTPTERLAPGITQSLATVGGVTTVIRQ